MHYRVLDPRSRLGLSSIALRIFLEYATDTDLPPITRVAALFAVYVFHGTQPNPDAPELARSTHIPISYDMLELLVNLPEEVNTPELAFLRPSTAHVLRACLRDQVFYILPHSSHSPQDPRHLPRFGLDRDEVVQSEPQPAPQNPDKRRKPTKAEKMRSAREATVQLTQWLGDGLGAGGNEHVEANIHSRLQQQTEEQRTVYQEDKVRMLQDIEQNSELLHNANQDTLAQVKRIQEDAARHGMEVGAPEVQGAGTRATALQRVEQAAGEWSHGKGGVLGFLEGSGLASKE